MYIHVYAQVRTVILCTCTVHEHTHRTTSIVDVVRCVMLSMHVTCVVCSKTWCSLAVQGAGWYSLERRLDSGTTWRLDSGTTWRLDSGTTWRLDSGTTWRYLFQHCCLVTYREEREREEGRGREGEREREGERGRERDGGRERKGGGERKREREQERIEGVCVQL